MYDAKEFGFIFGLTGIYKQRVLFNFSPAACCGYSLLEKGA